MKGELCLHLPSGRLSANERQSEAKMLSPTPDVQNRLNLESLCVDPSETVVRHFSEPRVGCTKSNQCRHDLDV